MRSTRILISSALLICLGSMAGADIINEWKESRKKIAPFAADYLEVITVAKEGEVPRGATSWGSENSRLEYFCAVDQISSYVVKKPYNAAIEGSGTKVLVSEEAFSKGGIHYGSVTDGLQAFYGHRSPAIFNVAAAGYELFTYNLDELSRYREPVITGPLTISVNRKSNDLELTLKRFGDQVTLSEVKGPLSKQSYYMHKVTEWQKSSGFYYPKTVTQEFYRDNLLTQSRTYTLLRILPSKAKVLNWNWKEGAIVKDTDTQTVYFVKDGKLIIDERFMPASAGLISLGNILVLASFVAIAVIVIFVFKHHQRARGKLT